MKLKSLRWIVQGSAFIASNLGFTWVLKTGCVSPFLFCYGCPYASSGCPLGSFQHFIANRAFPFYVLGMVAIFGLIFGRSLCGWACSFGTFHDILSRPIGTRKKRLKPLSYAKFAMLFITILAAWITVETFFCKFCPAGTLFAAIPAPFFYEGLNLGSFWYVHLGTLAMVIVLALVFSRFWCRYLCPFGTIGIFNKASLITISHVPHGKYVPHDPDVQHSPECEKCEKLGRKCLEEGCLECNRCLDVCTMGITKVIDIGKSTDCILCGRCVDVCPVKHIKLRVRG